MNHMPEVGHIMIEQLGAYLERRLTDAERREVEAHLADCPDCRGEVLDAARILRLRRTRRYWYFTPPAVAAAAGLIVLLGREPQDTATTEPVVRAGESEILGVEAVTPVAGAGVAADSLRFVWQPLAEGARYRFVLATTAGTSVWSLSLADTHVTIPDSVAVTRGETYIWYVDALLLDGRSAKTQERRVLIKP